MPRKSAVVFLIAILAFLASDKPVAARARRRYCQQLCHVNCCAQPSENSVVAVPSSSKSDNCGCSDDSTPPNGKYYRDRYLSFYGRDIKIGAITLGNTGGDTPWNENFANNSALHVAENPFNTFPNDGKRYCVCLDQDWDVQDELFVVWDATHDQLVGYADVRRVGDFMKFLSSNNTNRWNDLNQNNIQQGTTFTIGGHPLSILVSRPTANSGFRASTLFYEID